MLSVEYLLHIYIYNTNNSELMCILLNVYLE